MTFREELILATLSQWQGSTLSARQISYMIGCSNVREVKRSLDRLTNAHYPVIKTDKGYSIPNNSTASYIIGLGLFGAMLSASLFLL